MRSDCDSSETSSHFGKSYFDIQGKFVPYLRVLTTRFLSLYHMLLRYIKDRSGSKPFQAELRGTSIFNGGAAQRGCQREQCCMVIIIIRADSAQSKANYASYSGYGDYTS